MNSFNGSTKIDIEGEKDFYKLAQFIGQNIQKIIHNGNQYTFYDLYSSY